MVIGFDTKNVSVVSNVIEIEAYFATLYDALLTASPPSTQSAFELVFDGETYSIRHNDTEVSRTHSRLDAILELNACLINFFIEACTEFLWLHAGAAARGGLAVLFPGPSMRGKSTIVSRLLSLGWTYLGDEMIALSIENGKVYPFPQAPTLRTPIGGSELSEKLSIPKTLSVVDPDRIARKPMTVGAIVFPAFRPSARGILVNYGPSAAALELALSCRSHFKNQRFVVKQACNLIRRVPVFLLEYCDGALAAQMVEEYAKSWGHREPASIPFLHR